MQKSHSMAPFFSLYLNYVTPGKGNGLSVLVKERCSLEPFLSSLILDCFQGINRKALVKMIFFFVISQFYVHNATQKLWSPEHKNVLKICI